MVEGNQRKKPRIDCKKGKRYLKSGIECRKKGK
jgi:hypothetical protein